MSGRAALVAMVGCALLAGAGCRRQASEEGAATASAQPAGERVVVALHFPAADGFLHLERREMSVPPAGNARLQAVIEALLAGPRQRGLLPLFPAPVEVGHAFVDAHGVAYLDLVAESQPAPPPSGSALELVRVFALVNTVLANEPRARGVVLLWNGVQRPTFAGHVDTIRPLTANHRLVR